MVAGFLSLLLNITSVHCLETREALQLSLTQVIDSCCDLVTLPKETAPVHIAFPGKQLHYSAFCAYACVRVRVHTTQKNRCVCMCKVFTSAKSGTPNRPKTWMFFHPGASKRSG